MCANDNCSNRVITYSIEFEIAYQCVTQHTNEIVGNVHVHMQLVHTRVDYNNRKYMRK